MAWIEICQWCGKNGTTSHSNTRPTNNPRMSFDCCPSHPSGNPDAKHGAQWIEI